MTEQQAGAAALIGGSMVWAAVMFVHPVHAGAAPVLAHFTLSDIVHGLALATKPVLLYGFWIFSRFLGLDRPLVAGAFAYFLFAMIMTAMAGAVSGWITPEVVSAAHHAAPADRAVLLQAGQLSALFNRGFTQVHLILASIAYVLWAVAWPGKSLAINWLRLWGVAVGLGILGWKLSGTLTPNAHVMPFVVLAQVSWAIGVAVFMLTTSSGGKDKGMAHD